jgi:hypothetical protein
MTGMIILFAVSFIVFVMLTFKYRYFKAGMAGTLLLLLLTVAFAFYLNHIYHKNYPSFDFTSVDKEKKTLLGNAYHHCFDCDDMENGTPVYIYICESELNEEWNKRSNLSFDSLDMKGHELKYTLIRYLASKNLKKDAEGIATLSPDDIKSIENGIANVNYNQMGSLMIRIHKTIAEWRLYRKGKNVSGSSMVQRFEFWRAGWSIFKDNWIIGTGTGDVKQAFAEKYVELNSPLSEKWRLRAHNQFLTFALTFGLPGFLLFVFTYLYPVFIFQKRTLIFIIFMAVSGMSFLNEDTLETQAGITFVMYFMSIFISVNANFHPLHEKYGRK